MDKNKIDQKLRVFYTGPKPSVKEKMELIVNVRDALMGMGDIEVKFDWLNEMDPYIPKEMYARVIHAIRNSDIVVAEITYPSTGVGLQLALAAQHRVPVLALRADWIDTPKQFAEGAQGDDFKIVNYAKGSLVKVLKENLRSMGKERFIKFNFVSTPEINAELDRVSGLHGVSRSHLLRQIIREWLVKD